MKKSIGFLALAIVVGGCAGGGIAKQIVPIGSKTRLVQVGDKLVFHMQGNFTPFGGTTTPGTGTATFEVISQSGNDFTYSEKWHLVSTAGKALDFTGKIVLKQDPDAKLWLRSLTDSNGHVSTVTNTTFYYPGTWSSGWSVNGVTTYSDGSSEHMDMKVLGTATVDIPLATFNTWACSFKDYDDQETYSNATEYWVPGYAYFAKAEGILYLGGGVLDGTLTLESTNIPLPTQTG